MKMRFFKYCFFSFISLFCLLSCGLEAFYYIDYIPEGDYDGLSSVIQLPSSSTEGYSNYFTNYIIFYRIYISAINANTGPHLRDVSQDRIDINSLLNSDYNNILPSTDITSTTVNTSNLENTFLNRNYFALNLEGEDAEKVLGSSALGKTLEIIFHTSNGTNPTLTLDGGITNYNLQRAVSGPGINDFRPRPDSPSFYRKFINHPDLYNKENVSNDINRDVATNTRDTDLRYTYVTMYIAAKGLSLEMPPRAIYSQPTFIGFFKLTDW